MDFHEKHIFAACVADFDEGEVKSVYVLSFMWYFGSDGSSDGAILSFPKGVVAIKKKKTSRRVY